MRDPLKTKISFFILLKAIANKIYRGENIHYRLPKSRIIKQMTEVVSQLFHLPTINDATVKQSLFSLIIISFS